MSRRWPQRAIAIRSRYWARMTVPTDAPFAPSCRAPRRRGAAPVRSSPLGSAGRGRHAGLFEGLVSEGSPYLLRIKWPQAVQETEDPYSFGPLLGELDLHLFNEGRHFHLAEALGANVVSVDGVEGVRFAVWAPNAARVAVIGDFNSWDTRRHPMRLRFPLGHLGGVRAAPRGRRALQVRYFRPGRRALAGQGRPGGAAGRARAGHGNRSWPRRGPSAGPMIGGWQGVRAAIADRADFRLRGPYRIMMRPADDRSSIWDLATERLVPYLGELGFNTLELLPITEHPFGARGAISR